MRKKYRLTYFAAIIIIVGLFSALSKIVVPSEGLSDGAAITMQGDGVREPVVFSITELRNMKQVQVQYSVIDAWPEKKRYTARGVSLADLLTMAGMRSEAEQITVTARDGGQVHFTVEELLNETLIALAIAEGDNFKKLDAVDTPMLIMGQRWIAEQTQSVLVNNVVAIDVSVKPLAQPEDVKLETGGSDMPTIQAGGNDDQIAARADTDSVQPLNTSIVKDCGAESSIPVSEKPLDQSDSELLKPDAKRKPDQIFLSWTEDPLTTQSITWRTEDDVMRNQVQYLPAAVFKGDFDGAPTAAAIKKDLYAGYVRFEATLRGLDPGTAYVYQVGQDGAWQGVYTFTTAEANDHFSFAYMGDVQEGYDYWGEALQSTFADNPDLKFGLLGGDLVDHSTAGHWQQFFAAVGQVFARIPFMPTAGNHDESDIFWNTFALPQNGPDGYEEQFYSFDYGNGHFAVLDSNFLGSPGIGDYDRLSAWLENDLAKSSRMWKFIILHHPPYPAAADSHAENLQANWVPIFERGGVDVVFAGHQHIYMRTKPLEKGQILSGGGITYIIGNSGTKHYGAGPGFDYVAREITDVSNCQIIEIKGDTLTMTSKNVAGEAIDSFSLTKKEVVDFFE